SLRRFEPPDRRKPCRSCSRTRSRTLRSSISGVVAGIIGSRIFAWQWSQSSAQAPAVTEKAGNEFLPQPFSSLVAYSLNVGVEKRIGRDPDSSAAPCSSSATRSASNAASSSASIDVSLSSHPMPGSYSNSRISGKPRSSRLVRHVPAVERDRGRQHDELRDDGRQETDRSEPAEQSQ